MNCIGCGELIEDNKIISHTNNCFEIGKILDRINKKFPKTTIA